LQPNCWAEISTLAASELARNKRFPHRGTASQQLAAFSWFAVGKGEREGSRGMGGVLAGSAEAVQEVKQIVGVLAGVEADEEVRRPMPPGDLLEALPEQRVTGYGLG
jgi:hypothetical protein